MNQVTQETRHDSYIKVDKTTRQEVILDAFRTYGNMTARECMHKLGKSDPNFARPRITELVDQNRLVVCGVSYDNETSRNVTLFGIPNLN